MYNLLGEAVECIVRGVRGENPGRRPFVQSRGANDESLALLVRVVGEVYRAGVNTWHKTAKATAIGQLTDLAVIEVGNKRGSICTSDGAQESAPEDRLQNEQAVGTHTHRPGSYLDVAGRRLSSN